MVTRQTARDKMTKNSIQASIEKNLMSTDFSAVDMVQSAANESAIADSATNDDSLDLENSQNVPKNDDSAELLN